MTPANVFGLGDAAGERVILHLDLDAFYTQVERNRLELPPEVPLCVQQWSSLIAVCYNSRKLGVKRMTSAADAAKLGVTNIHVEVVGGKAVLDRYRRAGREVMNAVLESLRRGDGAVVCEKASIDECYFDVSAAATALARELGPAALSRHEYVLASHVVGAARETARETGAAGGLDAQSKNDLLLMAGAVLAMRARKHVLEKLNYTLSAGISHNKLLAKLASSRNKPAKQTIVPFAQRQSMLETLPLQKLRGLGGKLGESVVSFMHSRLSDQTAPGTSSSGPQGDFVASDLQRFPLGELERAFGDEKTAQFLYNSCRGVDEDEVIETLMSKSLLAMKSFDPVRNIAGIAEWLQILAREIAGRLEEDREMNGGRRARTLVLHYRGGGPDTYKSRTRSFPMPTHAKLTEDVIKEAALKQFKMCEPGTTLPCTRIGLSATNFTEVDAPGAGGGAQTSMVQFFRTAGEPTGKEQGKEPFEGPNESARRCDQRRGATGEACSSVCSECGVPVSGDNTRCDFHLALHLQKKFEQEDRRFAQPRKEAPGASFATKRRRGPNSGSGNRSRLAKKQPPASRTLASMFEKKRKDG